MRPLRFYKKCYQEDHTFQSRWDAEYLFIEFKGKPMCLVCSEIISVMNDFNLSCHYNCYNCTKYNASYWT